MDRWSVVEPPMQEETMTVRERRWIELEYERSHRSVRRILILSAIVVAGALLGYRGGPPNPGRATPVTQVGTP
jgi:hypothetical protein